jgi:hypothetical protein
MRRGLGLFGRTASMTYKEVVGFGSAAIGLGYPAAARFGFDPTGSRAAVAIASTRVTGDDSQA